jgi:hypothetical protein
MIKLKIEVRLNFVTVLAVISFLLAAAGFAYVLVA